MKKGLAIVLNLSLTVGLLCVDQLFPLTQKIKGAAIAQTQAAAIPAPEPGLREDTYAVYSAVMSNPQFGSGTIGNTGTYLIEGTTMRSELHTTPLCGSVPAAYQAGWAEILDEFYRFSYSAETLETAFKLPKPYVLLNAAEQREFMNYRSSPLAQNSNPPSPKFQGASQLFRLSHVFFNRNRTLALTEVGMWCGGMCGKGGGRVLEKVNGQWRYVEGIRCSTWTA